MTPNQFAASIRFAWQIVRRAHLGRSFSTPVSLAVDNEFRDLALDETSSFEDIYLCGLRKSHYNFILTDSSYFQFSLGESDLRYAYLPNPYLAEQDEATRITLDADLQSGDLTFEEYAELVAETPVSLGAPPIRYEFAPLQYREIKHPCAHLHIGHHSSNRWPVARKLHPLAFTMLILQKYYGAAWSTFDNDTCDFLNALTDEFALERARCPTLPLGQFSSREGRLFHFL